jgi:hypothetical protein
MRNSKSNVDPSRYETTTKDRIKAVQNKLIEIIAHISAADLDELEYTDEFDVVLSSVYFALAKIHRDLYVRFDTSQI